MIAITKYNQKWFHLFLVYKEGSASDKSGHVIKHEESQDESSAEASLDPKIRKGLERIRKLDAILADKLKVDYVTVTFS